MTSNRFHEQLNDKTTHKQNYLNIAIILFVLIIMAVSFGGCSSKVEVVERTKVVVKHKINNVTVPDEMTKVTEMPVPPSIDIYSEIVGQQKNVFLVLDKRESLLTEYINELIKYSGELASKLKKIELWSDKIKSLEDVSNESRTESSN